MDRTYTLSYQGKRFFALDFTNLQTIDEIADVIKKARDYIHRQPPASVYTLTNIEGMHFNNLIRDMFQELAKSNKPFVKAGAIVGVTGMKQILFNGIMKLTGRDIKSFSDLESAKKWLSQQN
jgi:hypothetical protein